MLESLSLLMILITIGFCGFLYRMERAGRRDEAAREAGKAAAQAKASGAEHDRP